VSSGDARYSGHMYPCSHAAGTGICCSNGRWRSLATIPVSTRSFLEEMCHVNGGHVRVRVGVIDWRSSLLCECFLRINHPQPFICLLYLPYPQSVSFECLVQAFQQVPWQTAQVLARLEFHDLRLLCYSNSENIPLYSIVPSNRNANAT
jgi:hypothetical protein